jgi:stress response protein YsnF
MANSTRSTIAGVFANGAEAEWAVHELQRANFSNDQIRVSVYKGDGEIIDGLIGMGFPPNEAHFYNQEYRAGRTVVAVKTADRQQEAADILRLGGAYDADTRPGTGNGSEMNTGGVQTLQLREETLQVAKQWVQTGEIRIRKRVITEEKVFKVPVSREEVIIERVPFANNSQNDSAVSGSMNATDIGVGEGEILTLEEGKPFTIQVREEQVFIQKTPMVIEEITLTKQVIQETKAITDTVQREELHVERTGDVRIQGDNVEDVVTQS